MIRIVPPKQITPQPPEPTMRQERTVQGTLFDIFAEHEIGRELMAMSQWLDEHRDVLGLVVADLRRHGLKDTGRHGLTAETVLRCALLNLASGRSGLILDVVIEAGNPADSARFLPMLERHVAHHDAPPRQTATDGGYASTANLKCAKALGVEDVAFHKKCRLAIEDMVKNRWVYRKLRNFRAGIEANISCLKRAFGLRRCTWRGLAHFQSYVWSSVVAYNLALFARLAQL